MFDVEKSDGKNIFGSGGFNNVMSNPGNKSQKGKLQSSNQTKCISKYQSVQSQESPKESPMRSNLAVEESKYLFDRFINNYK